ncbi:hypothetical protein JHK82_054913 [Glycine max]|uniref:Uncharacterized protein n=2 Tax=Glycine subgen. Soja TaxID=1462606 RepID=A0A0R0EGL3_SOYBN|nr:hypothetical protein JHK86_054759 [Glycine max]KAG5076218.1 hypothetical protein JHK82_054913 [Glycine max]KRG89288.1 hypothetical protein GLYMA_20G014000v4 [Glycine max]RZB41950.1 hypothetical protein D0Y65_052802 [Glycine soja]
MVAVPVFKAIENLQVAIPVRFYDECDSFLHWQVQLFVSLDYLNNILLHKLKFKCKDVAYDGLHLISELQVSSYVEKYIH